MRLFYRLLFVVSIVSPLYCIANDAQPYRSAEDILNNPPVAGEGFTTQFLGEEVIVPAMDRRSINAWVAGASLNIPAPSSRKIEPVAALYFWRRPDDRKVFYGDVAILYNSLFFAKNFEGSKNFEWVLRWFDGIKLPRLRRIFVSDRTISRGA